MTQFDTSGERLRQLAFRSQAKVRSLSRASAPDASAAYDHAQELAEQALNNSPNAIETQFAAQLRRIVVKDRKRHQRLTASYPSPA